MIFFISLSSFYVQIGTTQKFWWLMKNNCGMCVEPENVFIWLSQIRVKESYDSSILITKRKWEFLKKF